MTSEQIKQFENDVKNGKKVNINKYVKDDGINYNNKLSDTANLLSNGISKLVKGGVENTFKLLTSLIDN